ncbi:MAG TPA: hypothetical protein VM869_00220 [Enhygromyxa sp.]|nr:hypothetical protein [Enhygromyxa sp.]
MSERTSSSELQVELVPLEEALNRLAVQTSELSPDGIAEAVAPNDAVSWTAVRNWEEMDDLEIFAAMGLQAACSSSQLLVITEASFSKLGGAFRLAGRDLPEFIRGHLAAYGECFFNGDTIIMDRDRGTAWLFHHEGVYRQVTALAVDPARG